jgi:hypothetical protein
MIIRKSTCGLCKPHKKWKKNNTKAKRIIEEEIAKNISAFSFGSTPNIGNKVY